MKYITTSFNIVLKLRDFNPSNMRISGFKDAINDVRDDFGAPIINQLPGLTVFIYTVEQMSISFQDDTVVISDNSTDPVAARHSDLIDIVKTIEKKLEVEEDLFAYGYNFNFDIELEKQSTRVLQDMMNIANLEKKGLVSEGTLKTGAVKIVVEKGENQLSELNLVPLLKKNYEDSNKIRCSYNLHWGDASQLPGASDLKSDYLRSFEEITALLENLDE